LYDPEAIGASDYTALAKEVIAQETPAQAAQAAAETAPAASSNVANTEQTVKATQPTLPAMAADPAKDRASATN
jgi:hypothetical protein